MAEYSRLWTTNGTGDGTSTGYTVTDWENIWRYCFSDSTANLGGVLAGIGGQLGLSGATSPLTLATGAAMVYGHLYVNDTPLSLSVTTPVVGTTGGRVVLRVNWTAQTVRAFVVRNTDGVAAIPALTQTAGTTWEIPLLSFTITTAGAITYTAGTNMVQYSTVLDVSRLRGGASEAIAYGNTDGSGSLANSVGLYWRAALKRLDHVGDALSSTINTEYWIEQDSVATPNDSKLIRLIKRVIAGGGWENTAFILKHRVDVSDQSFISFFRQFIGVNKEQPSQALDVSGRIAVNPTSANTAPFVIGANGSGVTVPGLKSDNSSRINGTGLYVDNRQGGLNNYWAEPGTTNYSISDARLSAGMIMWAGNASAGTVTITMPVSYNTSGGLAFCNVTDTSAGTGAINNISAHITAASGTAAIQWKSISGASYSSVTFTWLVLGGTS